MSIQYPYEAEQVDYRVPSSVRRGIIPGGRVLLREQDMRHRRLGNELGQILVYEGGKFTGYPTPAVKALSVAGKIVPVEAAPKKKPGGAGQADAAEPAAAEADAALSPAAGDVGSLFEDPRIVDALTAAGIDQVKDLVDAYRRGLLDTLPGITAARRRTIKTALVRDRLIDPSEADES